MLIKEKYFYIDNIHFLDLNYIKKTKAKLIIRKVKESQLNEYLDFVRECKNNNITVYIANNIKLLFKLKLNHFYLSAYNKQKFLSLKKINKKINIIGGAHNLNQIKEKIDQGCSKIILSRLFKSEKLGFLDIVKFNFLTLGVNTDFIALGGINKTNYKKLAMVNCIGAAMKSEVLRKPKYLKI